MIHKRITILPRTRLLTVAFVLQLPLLVFAGTYWLTDSGFTACLCGLTALPTAILGAAYLGARDFDAFSPLLAVTAPIFIGTTLRTQYLVFSKTGRPAEILDGVPIRELMVGGIIVAVACASLAFGYVIAARYRFDAGRLLAISRPWSRQRLFWLGCVCAVLAVVCTIDLMRQTGFQLSDLSLQSISSKRRLEVGGGGQHVTTLGYHRWGAEVLPAIALYFAVAAGFQTSLRLPRVYLVGLAGLVLLTPFLSSSRLQMCFVVINLLIIIYYRSRISLVGAGTALASVITIVAAVALIREGVITTESAGRNVSANLLLDTLIGNESFTDIIRVTRMYQGVPDILPYKHGTSFVTWLVAPVPRLMWEGKPAISQGLEITRELYGGRVQGTGVAGGGRPPGLICELIMNFGVVAVPVGALIYGFGLRVMYNTIRPFLQTSIFAVVLYVSAYLPATFMVMVGDFSRSAIELLMRAVTTCLFAYLLLQRGRLKQSAREGPFQQVTSRTGLSPSLSR